MNKTKIKEIAIGTVVVLFVLWIASLFPVKLPLGQAPSGLVTTVATSTKFTADATIRVLAATSTCTARIITTGAAAVLIDLSDRDGNNMLNLGHWQAASTTVSYDSGIYGCDLWRIRGDATSITQFTETR